MNVVSSSAIIGRQDTVKPNHNNLSSSNNVPLVASHRRIQRFTYRKASHPRINSKLLALAAYSPPSQTSQPSSNLSSSPIYVYSSTPISSSPLSLTRVASSTPTHFPSFNPSKRNFAGTVRANNSLSCASPKEPNILNNEPIIQPLPATEVFPPRPTVPHPTISVKVPPPPITRPIVTVANGSRVPSYGIGVDGGAAHKSSRFHSNSLVLWNSWGYAAAHLNLIGAIAYLIIDQVTDFSGSVSPTDVLLFQTILNIALTMLLVVDAICYYKGSMFAPWKWQPNTKFRVLSPEAQKYFPCLKPPTPIETNRVAHLSSHKPPPTFDTSSFEASAPNSAPSTTRANSLSSNSGSLDRSFSESPRSSRSVSSTSSPESNISPPVPKSAPTTVPAMIITTHTPTAPEDDLGYFFPLTIVSLGEAFNILASLTCFIGALYAIYPLIHPDMNEDDYTYKQHMNDLMTMVIWTLSAAFYHRDWQINYSNQTWWFNSLDGTGSVCNVVASCLYIYTCMITLYLGRVAPNEWRFLQNGESDYNDNLSTGLNNSTDIANSTLSSISNQVFIGITNSTNLLTEDSAPFLANWIQILWHQIIYCGLLADCLYLLSALLYEISDMQHRLRVRSILMANAKRLELSRGQKSEKEVEVVKPSSNHSNSTTDDPESVTSNDRDASPSTTDSSPDLSRRSSERDRSSDSGDDEGEVNQMLVLSTPRSRQRSLMKTMPIRLSSSPQLPTPPSPPKPTDTTHPAISIPVHTATVLATRALFTRRLTNRILKKADIPISEPVPVDSPHVLVDMNLDVTPTVTPSNAQHRDLFVSLSPDSASLVSITTEARKLNH